MKTGVELVMKTGWNRKDGHEHLLLVIPNVLWAHTHGHVFVIQLLLQHQSVLFFI